MERQDYFLSDTLADVRPSPEDQCASLESHGLLMQFVSELPPSMQEAIQMRYVDRLSIARSGANFAGSNRNLQIPPAAGSRTTEVDDARSAIRRGLPK